MPMAEDMAAFFNADEFATPAQLDGVAVLGILDQPYMRALDGIASSSPTFVLPTASAAGTRQGAWLQVGGATYRVRSVQPDGTGATLLELEQRP